MANLVAIPDIGDDEVTCTAILVKVGDTIAIDQDVISLEGDKASMDVPSPVAGTIGKILVNVGDLVKTGSPMFEMSESAAAAHQVKVETPSPTAPVEATVSAEEVVNIPDIGDDEVTCTAILVAVGDSVDLDQDVISLEGDKASMDVPSPKAGKVLDLLVKVGDKVKTGSAMFKLAVAGSSPADQVSASTTPSITPTTAAAPVTQNICKTGLSQDQVSATKVFSHASPSVRRKARKYGVNLDLVKGSGEKNRVIPADIESYIKAAVQNFISGQATGGTGLNLEKWPSIDFSKFGKTEVQELSKIQKISGRFLHRNWVYIPHVTQFEKADITDLENFRKEQNNILAKKKSELKITPLVFILKAVAKTLEQFPKFKSSLSEDAGSIIYKDFINIGVAVDTPNGLVVPVFKDVNKKGIFELSQELAAISKKARDGKLTASDMSGGTFTISSLGGIGGTSFTPIVNAPEVAILGLSRSSMEPVFNGKDFDARLLLPLCLSYDHRAIDGADGARFIVTLANVLKDLRTLIL